MSLFIKQWIVLCVACASLSAGAVSYTAVDVGTLGGSVTNGRAINPSGWVTGSSYLPGNQAFHAFLWNGGTLHDLGTLGGPDSYGAAINASGWVTGGSLLSTPYYKHAFLWNGSRMQNLGTLGGDWGSGVDINDSGWVVGYDLEGGDVASHAFIWDGSGMRGLTPYNDPRDSYAIAINASGWVIGDVVNGGSFLWNGSSMQDLGTLGVIANAINPSGWVTGSRGSHAIILNERGIQDLGTLGGDTRGTAINASGWVAGVGYLSPSSSASHAFLWNGSSLQDLGTLGGTKSEAVAINGSGWVVGRSTIPGDIAFHAFVWDGSRMIDLNSALPNDNPFVLTSADDINDSGQILASGTNASTSEIHAFVLSPVQFTFNGFFPPVANLPQTNVVKSGQAVPLKFGLDGNQGLDIFAPGYPASQRVDCATLGGLDAIEPTVTAGASGLQYDAVSGQYTYVWKTNRSWANTCRQLILKFDDGSQHTAKFQFKN